MKITININEYSPKEIATLIGIFKSPIGREALPPALAKQFDDIGDELIVILSEKSGKPIMQLRKFFSFAFKEYDKKFGWEKKENKTKVKKVVKKIKEKYQL